MTVTLWEGLSWGYRERLKVCFERGASYENVLQLSSGYMAVDV